jgi:2-oxoglutarate ferredoxin oxidoreductase subunit alpha
VSYDPLNHEHMVKTRAAKVANLKPPGQAYVWTGRESGEVLIIGWGGTYGAIRAATLELEKQGVRASACHLRYLNPMPGDLSEIIRRFAHVVVPELNMGQLRMLLRARYLVDAKGINKVRGQPFTIGEIVRGVRAILDGRVEVLEEDGAADKDILGGG